jgi:hypothetical protein
MTRVHIESDKVRDREKGVISMAGGVKRETRFKKSLGFFKPVYPLKRDASFPDFIVLKETRSYLTREAIHMP